MNNDQNNPRIKGSGIDVNELKENDYNYRVIHDDGFYYFLCMHKYGPLLIFARGLIGTESKMGINYSWVDEKAMGRYINLVKHQEAQTIPAELVRTKYNQISSYFDILENVENELRSGRATVEKEELKSEINSHLIRLVNLLFYDLANNGHAAEAIKNELSLTICNNADNEDIFTRKYSLTKNDEWLHLTFSNNNYYLDESSLQENTNILFYVAVHKTLNQIIFVRAPSPKFKTTVVHHLYINKDDGLGRYKVQTNEGVVSNQFFVPVDYVMDRCDRFRGFMEDFKRVQDTTDVYTKQIIWCKLQDDAIHLINYILWELDRDLKQHIDKSLNHYIEPLDLSLNDSNNFEEFYNKVVEREKRIRLQLGGKTYPNDLVIFNKSSMTTSVIHIDNFENDVFLIHEKIRIFISMYDPDYYLMVGEAWMPKNQQIQQRISAYYQHGNIVNLPNHEKTEIITFVAKTKNSTNQGPDKFELYEIIREKQNDEESRVLELRKFGKGRLEMGYQDLIGSGV
jgi:hypothetical protein